MLVPLSMKAVETFRHSRPFVAEAFQSLRQGILIATRGL